ncbi:response regulator [Sphingomonas morindae]|uniref:histidine kinase n=1 Tax=Sphingomonas morindae TaxID=1541170 RepID=A0ABY4X8V8_9SPHN|nr:response regulator [Sphingomonas morindae]USI73372.1 response regulator [Sphingomonas morindae]
MRSIEDPAREAARLAALHRLDLLDSPAEAEFDDLVALARAATGAEIALVSLIDADRQWFKARSGLTVSETPRSAAFCDHAVRAAAALVVPDAAADARFADNPLVLGAPFIRFYAGAPIFTPDGHAIGTVCAIDSRPRQDFRGLPALEALARQASALIELRRLSHRDAQQRDALARELDRLWTLAHDLILLCDLEGRVIAANPAWAEVFGAIPADAPIFMRDFLVDPAQRPRLEGIADGTAFPITLDYRGHDGMVRTISWTLRREGAMIYAIGRDDTALRAAERELVQAQRMESLGQLTGGIAHDFNNLLTIVIGNLDIARRRLAGGDLGRVERALGEAGEGAARAATLTQRLLAFARRQRLAPRAIAPAVLLADMRPLIERAILETATLDMVVEDGAWPIQADAGQLENSILNLAVNARDAMAGLGPVARLTIGAANQHVGGEEAARHGVAPGDYLRITVADTGAGMTREVLERAFEPFFTTKGIGRGTGLGLSQVDGFVRQSGGFVTIDTTPGAGTLVHLWLPRSPVAPDPAAPPPSQAAAQGEAPRGLCVMVVEDNDSLRQLAVETLRDAGYRVIEAHDGRAALSLFKRQAVPPTLVLSDVMMPGLDGFSLAEEIRRRAPATEVVLMSGYAGVDGPQPAAERVALTKPFTPADLLACVRAALAGKTVPPAPLTGVPQG